jgi:ferredoxin
MTGPGHRLRENAAGRYYVTDACNGCGICALYAGTNFERGPAHCYYYVVEQPRDEWEEQAMIAAQRACALGCIRGDGDGL